MDEIGPDLKRYIDEIARPIEIDELGATDAADHAPTGPRWSYMAAAFVLVCGAAIVVLRMVGSDADTVVVTSPDLAPTEAVPPAKEWGWLDPFGAESPIQPIQAGWSVLEFDAFRFAVPETWTVPWGSCGQPSAGLVLVTSPGESPSCPADETAVRSSSILRIEPTIGAIDQGAPVDIGTLTATPVVDEDCAAGCPTIYRFDNGMQVSATGPDAEAVLATFTDSGPRRVLQSGREADTTNWKTVSFGGVEFLVSALWPVVDLPGSYSEIRGADGSITSLSGRLNPGECGGVLFAGEGSAEVYTGVSPIIPSCPAPGRIDLRVGNGVWIRILDEGANSVGTPIASGTVDGLHVTVVDVDRPSPVLDLIVAGEAETVWISIGIGLDTSTTRSILRSIRSSSGPTEAAATQFAGSLAHFENPTSPTAADLLVLEDLVTMIAEADPILAEFAGPPPWSQGDVRPVFWNDRDLPGGAILIGATLELELEPAASYRGLWPTTGCTNGDLRGVIREARAENLSRVAVIVDINFERVTDLSMGGPTAPGEPADESSLEFEPELETRPWYTGPCGS